MSTTINLQGDEVKSLIEGLHETYANPNLLDNWYFGNPVNQRGATSYRYGNGLDRWVFDYDSDSPNANVTIENSGVTTTAHTGKSCYFQQRFELKPTGTYTLSVLVDAVSGRAIAQLRSNGSYLSNITLEQGLNTITYQNATPDRVNVQCNNGGSVTIKAIKLELGSQQTLAHQENGVWVLNELPDYGEQLRKCQRYFRRILGGGAYYSAFSGFVTASGAHHIIQVPIGSLRTTPTVVVSSDAKWTLRDANGYLSYANQAAATAVSSYYSGDNPFLTLNLQFGSNASSRNNTPIAATLGSGYIDISSEL